MILLLIAALKRLRDSDERLTLDRDQSRQLLFLLYMIDEGDGASIRQAIKDLLGVLPDEREESA